MIRKIRNGIAAAAFTTLVALAAPPVHAVDGVSLELGRGNEDTRLWRAGLQWNWRDNWLPGNRKLHVSSYWDLSYGEWRAPGNPSVRDLSFTPVFRMQGAGSISPYVEGAIGFHLLSRSEVTQNRLLGMHFQFGSHIGGGLRFGPRSAYDLSVRLQHLSNAGIASPNNGINFGLVRLQYHFD
jgi:lipid A 3-O-deacylase